MPSQLSGNRCVVESLEPRQLLSVQPIVAAGAYAQSFVSAGNLVYYDAPNANGNSAIWRTDGTAAGTFAITPLTANDTLNEGVVGGDGKFYFMAHQGLNQYVGVTDGTAANTTFLKETHVGENNVRGLIARGNSSYVYFLSYLDQSAWQLWRTDGTSTGTVAITVVGGRSADEAAPMGYAYGNYFLFDSYANANGHVQLWKTAGTAATTSIYMDFQPNVTPIFASLGFDGVGSKGVMVYATESDGKNHLAVVDGFSSTVVADLTSSSSFRGATIANGKYAWIADSKLYESDITNGTVMLATLPYDTQSAHLVSTSSGTLYFTAQSGRDSDDQSLWTSDGTIAGTRVVTDLNMPWTGRGTPADFTPVGNGVYFLGGYNGDYALYHSDGTAAGTIVVPGTTKTSAHSAFGTESGISALGSSIVGTWSDLSTGTRSVVTVTPAGSNSISGVVFDDLDHDGTQDAGEIGLIRTVYLDTNGDKQLDNGEVSTTTAANGSYAFAGLDAGTYTVTQVIPSKWAQTYPGGAYTIVLDGYESAAGRNFGVNGVPNASAGGPYTVAAGASIALNGSASSTDPNLSIASVAWDLNYNGSSFNPNATGLTPTFSAAGLSAGSRNVAMRVTDTAGDQITVLGSVTITAQTTPTVTAFNLYNASTDQLIQTITDGMTLDLTKLPTRNLAILAATSPYPTGSVKFGFDAKAGTFVANYRTETAAPYALFGDTNGDLAGAALAVGNHTLTATAYTGAGATGAAGTAVTIHFTVVDPKPAAPPAVPGSLKAVANNSNQITITWTDSKKDATSYELQRSTSSSFTTVTSIPIANGTTLSYVDTGLAAGTKYYYRIRAINAGSMSAFTSPVNVTTPAVAPAQPTITSLALIDAATDKPAVTLTDGMIISLKSIGVKSFNIQAVANVQTASVKFDYNGKKSYRIESSAPFALFGDTNGDYAGMNLAIGSYTIVATPYSSASAKGTAGAAVTIRFTVTA